MRPIVHTGAGVIIRPARTSDAPTFHASCYADRDWPQFARRFRAGLLRQRMGSLLHLVADAGTEIVAGCKLISYTERLEIADLIVSPPWRNRGLGTAFIQLMLEIGYGLGAAQIEIGVLQHNDRARSLYQRLGFRHARELCLPGKEPAFILVHLPAAVHEAEENPPQSSQHLSVP